MAPSPACDFLLKPLPLLACLLFACAARCLAQSPPPAVPEANPARPTVSTPATLTPVGYLQFENGVFFASRSPEFSTLFELNQVTKLTVHPRLQLILQTAPLARSEAQGQSRLLFGDVLVGAQAVALAGKGRRPTISFSYLRQVYDSPSPDVDFGTPRQSVLILVSDDLRGFHFDANGLFNEQRQGPVARAQYGQTLSISHPLKAVVISGEIWHFSQPFLHGDAVGTLWAISHSFRPNLVADGGFDRGLTRTSTHWEAFAGFTYLLPHRLWKQRS